MNELAKLQLARSKANKNKKAAAQARIDAHFFGIPAKAGVGRRAKRRQARR